MNVKSYASIALACAAAVLGASCSNNGTPAISSPASTALQGSVYREGFQPNPALRLSLTPPKGKAKHAQHIAVAEFGAPEVFWFPLNDKKDRPPNACEAASKTNGIAIDQHRNLWIPNGQTNTITEYAPNCGAAKLTISDTTGEPADIGFDGNDRVYALNLNDVNGAPTVEIYNTSSGAHLGTLSDPSLHDVFGIGTDGKGNIFVSNLTTANAGTVVEFPKGKMPGTVLSGIALGLPGGPTFDRANNMIITDWERYTIDVFAPPYTGSPTTAALKGASIWCKLDAKESGLYCGDADNGAIDVYGYPGLQYDYSYTAGLSSTMLVTGVAPDPPAKL